MAFYTRQITFKVSQAVATQLDHLGASRDLSRNLMAKELVVAALNGAAIEHPTMPAKGTASFDSELDPSPAENANPGEGFWSVISSPLADAAAAKLMTELRDLRSSDIARIRRDIRRLAIVFFCQAGLEIETARERTNVIFGVQEG